MRTLISLLLLCASLRGGGSDVVVVVGRPTAASSTLNTSLISYWKLEEASGTRVDSEPTGTPQDLTDNNTVTQNTGKISNAAQFTAANSENLSRADSADLSTGDIDFTVAAWVYFDSVSAGRMLVTKGGNGQEEFFLDLTAANEFRFYINISGANYKIATTSGFGATTGTWYLVVGWHDSAADTVNIQVNNGSVASTATTGSATADRSGTFFLGAYWNGVYHNGRIDEVGFWKKVLTSDERTELYNGGTGKTCCPF
jgi:hypothetical protein